MIATPNAPGPYDIVFTQYLMPDGRTQAQWIERPPAIVALAAQITAAGYHFGIEMLSDYRKVSMTVEPNAPDAEGEDAPIAQEVCDNGPEVPIAVDRLIAKAYERVFPEGAQ